MTKPNEGGWTSVEALFHEALQQPSQARGTWLAQTCSDVRLRADVQALLTAHGRRGVLDELIDDVMAPMLPSRTAAPTLTRAMPADSRYRVIERLGGGGMGVVYRARDERLNRDIALKFLSAHLSADVTAKKRFLIEARAAAAIEHPNICTVHEIGDTPDGLLYIVMACYDGETLDRRIARGPMPFNEALRIAGEIARGLSKAHERGIVHRDIKPANVMITDDGHVKILDFGIAKLADVTSTQTVGAIGTVAYMSPEQAFGESVDHRTDIWSLGVVFYEMIAGVRPFSGRGDQAVLVSALTADPVPLVSVRPDVPAALDALVRRMLAKRPADRVANTAELIAAITSCAIAPPVGAAVSVASSASIATGEPERDHVQRRESALTRGGERRQVTVVACTVEGQDALVERLDADESERVIARLHEAAAEVATQNGGIINQFAGDDLVMLFGVPTAHEDDAVRGARAALALRERIAEVASTLDARLAASLRVRVGIHVGALVAQRLRSGDRRFRISGAPADMATRLAAAADPDTILVSPEVRRLVAAFMHTEPSAPVVLPGDTNPATPHRILHASDARSRREAGEAAGLRPFVGRARERAMLAEHVESARQGQGRFTVLIGEAGAGKSRLLHELRDLAVAQGLRVIDGRCDAYGGSTPFLPFVDAAYNLLGLPREQSGPERHQAAVAAVRAIDRSLEEHLPFYLTLLAIPSEAYPVPDALRGERFQGAMLEAIAALYTLGSRTTPTLLLLEDWHWADEASRAALRQLAEVVPGSPLLLVVTSRPDNAFDWGSAEHQTLVHLPPLDGAASASIALAVFGADRMSPLLVARLHERTGGNPFFLEEVCEALREDGSVTVRDGEAVAAADSGTVHVPETVQGVLRARMDRLDDEAAEVLRVAAVIGREFSRGVLEDVVESPTDLVRSLERLKSSGLVQQIAVVPEPTFRFKHALTEEVAYDSLLEHQRTTLHDTVGRAIERRYAARIDEHVERLAHHFSRAEAWPDAVRYGTQSADRAMGLSQNADALHTLERVEAWVQRLPDDSARRDLLADTLLRQERLSEMLGLRARQLSIVDALISALAPFGPSDRLAQVYLRQGDAYTLLKRFEAADRALETALRITRERADKQGERNALRSIAFLRSHEGRHESALEKIEEVLALGRAAGDTRAQAGDLATLGNILRALGQLDRALAVLEAALERTEVGENPERYGALLNVMGTIHRELGNLDTALEFFRRTEAYLSVTVYASFSQTSIALIQLQQGRVEEALATYQDLLRLNRKAGFVEGIALGCRSLGEVLIGLDRHEESVPYLHESATLFAHIEDHRNEALMWRRLAGIHEHCGAPEQARTAWMKARELHRKHTSLSYEAEAVEGIARAERQLNCRPEQVVERYEEARVLAVREDDHVRELAIRNSLGIVHWQRGAYADAVREYEAALRICRVTSDRVHEGLILNSLGASLNKLRRWDEALTTLSEAVRVNTASGEQLLLGHALSALADVCIGRAQFRDALEYLQSAMTIRLATGDRRGEGWLLERMARAHRALGNQAEAASAAQSAERIAREVDDAALRDALTAIPPVAAHVVP
ncbi:serine/threonine-protein kinase PknK [Gemmatimonas sp.]|uniref:serine/threonine-protein kinase n=1 Tax=Gemmatimonas sp. TaxID=1962908 RepID=UPI00356B1010